MHKDLDKLEEILDKISEKDDVKPEVQELIDFVFEQQEIIEQLRQPTTTKKLPNFFSQNRRKVQKQILRDRFIQALSGSTFLIEERKKSATLRKVIVENVPYHATKPLSWEVNMEIENSVFKAPQKMVEKVLLVLFRKELMVFMFELKSSLKDYPDARSLPKIQEKFVDTMARMAILLPINIHDTQFTNVKIKYKGIICYRKNEITEHGNGQAIYDIFTQQNQQGRITFSGTGLGDNVMEIAFFKLTDKSSQTINIDFQELYAKRQKFLDKYCPH